MWKALIRRTQDTTTKTTKHSSSWHNLFRFLSFYTIKSFVQHFHSAEAFKVWFHDLAPSCNSAHDQALRTMVWTMDYLQQTWAKAFRSLKQKLGKGLSSCKMLRRQTKKLYYYSQVQYLPDQDGEPHELSTHQSLKVKASAWSN